MILNTIAVVPAPQSGGLVDRLADDIPSRTVVADVISPSATEGALRDGSRLRISDEAAADFGGVGPDDLGQVAVPNAAPVDLVFLCEQM